MCIWLLNMAGCNQLTDAAIVHLRGIHTLYMLFCDKEYVTDAAFVHLRGIHTLVIEACDQATIAGSTFAHLKGIHPLGMFECRDAQVAAARSLGLPVDTRDCTSFGALHYTFAEGTDQED